MATRVLGSLLGWRNKRTGAAPPSAFRRAGVRLWTRARELTPLTARGALVAGLSALALWYYGFEALDAVWYVTGLGLLGLSALTLLAVLAGALRMKLWLRSQAGPAKTVAVSSETGRSISTGFALPSLRFWLFVELRLTIREPSEVQVETVRDGGTLREQARFVDRGEVRRIARTIVVSDVFGLASLGLRHDSLAELDVLPHVGTLRSLPLLRSLAGGDDMPHPMGLEQGDRLELRRYAPGDPARFIHWKVYARTQKLVVRMPERALAQAQRVAAYLVAGPADEASAAAARVALEEGALGTDFRFAADGSPTPVRELAAALIAIRRSSARRAASAEQLPGFVQELDREGPSSLVLFVPAEAGPWVEQIGALLQKQRRTARVVIGVDGIMQRPGASWLERLTLAPTRSTQVPLAELRALITAYRRHGSEVVVVDRQSGRVLGEAHLRRAEKPQADEVAA
ncbi:MAG: hypothetical protein JWN48_3713 [Myxococcaceae bacterium]|nr:hypothetical protein [Myxococcaceae bacterium]